VAQADERGQVGGSGLEGRGKSALTLGFQEKKKRRGCNDDDQNESKARYGRKNGGSDGRENHETGG